MLTICPTVWLPNFHAAPRRRSRFSDVGNCGLGCSDRLGTGGVSTRRIVAGRDGQRNRTNDQRRPLWLATRGGEATAATSGRSSPRGEPATLPSRSASLV